MLPFTRQTNEEDRDGGKIKRHRERRTEKELETERGERGRKETERRREN